MFGLEHGGFIVTGYALVATILTGLIVWVVADHRAQKRAIAALEARGVRRRSAGAAPTPGTEG